MHENMRENFESANSKSIQLISIYYLPNHCICGWASLGAYGGPGVINSTVMNEVD